MSEPHPFYLLLGNLNDSSDNDMQLQQQLAASLGLDMPTTFSPIMKPSTSNPSLVTTVQDFTSLDDRIVLKSFKTREFDS